MSAGNTTEQMPLQGDTQLWKPGPHPVISHLPVQGHKQYGIQIGRQISKKSQQGDNADFIKGYLLWQLLLLQLWRVRHKSQRTKAKTETDFSNYFIHAWNIVEIKNPAIHFCSSSLCQNFFLRINADDNELELAVLQLLIDWAMHFSWMGEKGFSVSNHSCYAIILIVAGCMSLSPSHA